MQKIASLLGKVIRTEINEKMLLHMRLLDNWQYVVGEELKGRVFLEALRPPTIFVKVLSSASLSLKAQEEAILGRVNSLSKDLKFFHIVKRHQLETKDSDAA